MSFPKWLLLLSFIFLIILANQLPAVNAQPIWTCGTTGNYTSRSTYQTNLNSLLSSLSTNVDDNGFYNASVGVNNDTSYALVLCRGDIQLDTCRGCIQNTTVELVKACPNQRQAIYWHEFCMLRYSDEPMFRTLAVDPGTAWLVNGNVWRPEQFNEDLTNLLEDLFGQAANGTFLRKVAAGNRTRSQLQTLYALVQCTPDLTSEDCHTCLTNAARAMVNLNPYWRVLRPSCNLVYNSQFPEPFYNNSRLLELAGDPAVIPLHPEAPRPTPPEIAGNGDGDKNKRTIIIVAVSVSTSLILMVSVGILLRKRMEKMPNEELTMDEISNKESLQYEFEKIRAATNGFSEANKLGQGGFGSVYRGKLINGRDIAVKRLFSNSCQGDKEFKNEVKLLAKLQHRNLVRLLGFSLNRTEKLLVYELLQNASLDRFIFGPGRISNLDWEKRNKIIRGIAKGLLYLHEDSRLRIIHRDLKASNILLDEDMSPKIADFGSARLFVPDETRANTCRIVGTFGYMAPEYALHGLFSVKSDVFSFGVLVLEIISGQKNNSFHENGKDGEDLLIRVAWRTWQEGTAANLIDPTLRLTGRSGVPRDILRCIHIGLLCVQQNAGDRPTMASVVQMLNSFSSTLPVPSEPAYLFANDYTGSFTSEYSSRVGL